ncbi:LPXTG cell wall anchor domain-containing protein [Enterococcus sp. AZ163]|uniref:LPXTG cell wall anchor domain-containing protein n=1 Tax=Enterococcus sp. AZ163 TaxID=2774638 RepID=UPI003D279185
MKKVVLFSLLVLTFPIAAFAETTESVPNATISTQEQTIESVPAAEEVIDSGSTIDISTADADEQDKTTHSSTTDLEKKENVETKESTTQSSETKESDEPVKEETKDSETVKKEENKEYTPTVIREQLKDTGYGISQVELDSYTDQQLTTAWKIFERYNYDITGMDFGSYVRVLRKAYKDNVISAADAEKALAFNPSQYKTTDELIQNIDPLYNYIQALYPKGNGFIELSHLSKEELIHILNHLAPVQDKIAAINGNLFSGVVNWIQSSSIGNAPIDNGPRKNDQPTNVATNVNQNKETPTKAEQIVDQQATAQKQYPKTGEQKTIFLTIAGIVLVAATAFIGLRKKQVH